jgi:ATP-dependent helicase/nuclease subunit A
MNAPRIIPDEVLRRQIAASDPAVSAWVAANAGSGKTHVLAQRVIRLLLDGVDPAKILCITFTKAAAANMANRVFDELRRWTALGNDELDVAIARMSHVEPDPILRARARRLFATALETPGGLKVQTIHAFCTRLLHQFPFEANVAARFAVLDETAEAKLLNETSLGVLLEAAAKPDGALGRALATAIAIAADRTFKEVVAEAIRKRDTVRAWIDHGGSVDAAVAALCETLDITADDTIELVEAEMTEGPLLPSSAWPDAAATLMQGSKNDKDQARRLRSALMAPSAERATIYLQVFFTDKLEPRQRLVTRAIHPSLAENLDRERARLIKLLDRRKAVACRNRTRALLTIADAVISRYQAAKDRRGLLDYDDLIDKALALLGEDRAAWVHYKLDQGIDHVLIDEAQDTSPKQWQIIRLLTAEFFAGAGAREARRTIFAVGDEKQSIFSFQGAAPREFDAMRRLFASLCQGIERELHYIPFRHSFRSGPNVLGAVDNVFKRPEAYKGLSADDVATVHEWLPQAPPGMVELWETVKPKDKREIEAWDAPFDELTERSSQVRLAGKIATNVRRWIRQAARRLVRGDHPSAEGRACRGRRRRPADPDRAHRSDGPDGARRCAASARRRPRTGDRTEIAAVRARRRRPVQDRLGAQDLAAHGIAGEGGEWAALCRGGSETGTVRTMGERRHAVRLLRARAGRRARPRELSGPARSRGRRCARRVPQSRARLRAA